MLRIAVSTECVGTVPTFELRRTSRAGVRTSERRQALVCLVLQGPIGPATYPAEPALLGPEVRARVSDGTRGVHV